MVFNIDKCEVLQIILSNLAPVNYRLYDNPLRIVNVAKYLGVLLDSKLNFNRHIETICKKANGVLAFLKHNLYSCNQQIRNQAYVIYQAYFGVCFNSLGHHIQNQVLKSWKLYRGVQLGLLSQTMITQAVFLIFSINSFGPA